jgi:flagellar biosynthetic protein FliO
MRISPEALTRWLQKYKSMPMWGKGLVWVGLLAFVAVGLAISSTPAPASASAGDPFNNPTGLALDVFFKMGIVVVFIIGAALLLRRWQGGSWRGSQHQVSVVETIHLTPRRAIHLIQVGDRQLLIGATDQAVTLLSEVTEGAPLNIEKDQPMTVGTFADVLSYQTQPDKLMDQK